jgi:cellulose synthase/poly-beta-1,6-N-acetylglucosamine synthase-like glycosyltransferase
MPLGGTSNHFKADVLKALDGWDPFNVTEDCELGVRLYRMGYRTTMVDSTTWEEATSRLWNWMRQRSRWVKGFFQTHLAHMRNPFRTLRELGPWGFAGFLMCVGGSSLMMILNVIYWIIGGAYLTMLTKALAHGHTLWEILKGPREALAGNVVWPMIYYGPGEDPIWSSLSIVFFVIACVMLLANLLFVYMHLLACNKRHFHHLMPYALLMPFYWILISIGAWKGFLQLFTNPFYWEKTIHGMDAQACSKKPEL